MPVYRGDSRFVTRTASLTSRHSFSFGPHYDPGNTHHGLLLAHNEDTIVAGGGYATHPHQDTEILTWVLQGSLAHCDSTGQADVVYPGLIQRMSAGRGIAHSESNDAWRLGGEQPNDDPVHFLQMWIQPEHTGIPPGYQQLEVSDQLGGAELVPIASGMAQHRAMCEVTIHNRFAALHAARLRAGDSVTLPEAPFLHLFVAAGVVAVEGAGTLSAGDAARFTATGGQRVASMGAAEILVWEMHTDVAGNTRSTPAPH